MTAAYKIPYGMEGKTIFIPSCDTCGHKVVVTEKEYQPWIKVRGRTLLNYLDRNSMCCAKPNYFFHTVCILSDVAPEICLA